MIAYKVFRVKDRKLYPFCIDGKFEDYPLEFIHLRAKGCGPFTCFQYFVDAQHFIKLWRWWGHKNVIYKVAVKKSRA